MKADTRKSSKELVAAIKAITGKVETGSKEQLLQHLQAIRIDVAKEATKKESKAKTEKQVDALLNTVEEARKAALVEDMKLIKAMGNVGKTKSGICASVWLKQEADLKITHKSTGTGKDKVTVWTATPETVQRAITKRNGDVETGDKAGFHTQVIAVRIEALVDKMLEYSGTKAGKDYDFPAAKRVLNSSLRDNSKRRALANVQVQGNEKSGYYVREFEQSNLDVPFEALTPAEQKEVAKERLNKALTPAVLDNVTFNQSLKILIDNYVENGTTIDTIAKGLNSHGARINKQITKAA